AMRSQAASLNTKRSITPKAASQKEALNLICSQKGILRVHTTYPTFQTYFRTHQPPFLAVWGKNDPFFLPPGAEAFKRDNPKAVVKFFDTGHFALETHAAEIAQAIREFLNR
ncbi:alpha/beta fold hydrolase, partial [Bradyrhizobium brasilense]|uniref:alpha/beta fold hydrolase n=1 Tax=Bradyrhizobium brasilense TaxID=1419277 RepID=UPI001FCCFC34